MYLGCYSRINAFIRGRRATSSPSVFFRGQLLELIRWVAKYCPSQPPNPAFFSSAEHRDRFAKAAFICADLWSTRLYGGRLTPSADSNVDRLRALGPFRKGIEELGHAPNQAQTFGRGWSLFRDYFSRRYPEFGDRFSASTGFAVNDYLVLTAFLSLKIRCDANEPAIFEIATVIDSQVFQDRAEAYLALNAQSADLLAACLWGEQFEMHGYRAVREQPILRGQDGRMAILDPIFFAEKISIGPLFHLLPTTRGGEVNRAPSKLSLLASMSPQLT